MNLKKHGIDNYEVVFTLNGKENEHIQHLYILTTENSLPVRWIGEISREDVFGWYEKSALLFPSYIETIGLPIYEAIMVGSPIILSNCKYAKNIAGQYEKAYFFDYQNGEELAKYMEDYIHMIYV